MYRCVDCEKKKSQPASELGLGCRRIQPIEILFFFPRPARSEASMHLPKYSNPYLIDDATRIVSRRTLQLENDDPAQDGEAGKVPPEMIKEVDNLHARLDKIVSGRLKLKRAPESPEEPPRTKTRKIPIEGNSAGPQHLSEPVSEFTIPPKKRQAVELFSSLPLGIEITTSPSHSLVPQTFRSLTVGNLHQLLWKLLR